MDLLMQIQWWLLPTIPLTLMIFCLTRFRRRGGGLLAAGFGVLFVTDLLPRLGVWQLTRINLVVSAAFALLFMNGQSQILKTVESAGDGIGDMTLAQRSTSRETFGKVRLYMTSLYTSLLILAIGLSLMLFSHEQDAALAALAVGGVLLIVAGIHFLVLLYRIWRFAIVQCRQEHLAPSIKAAGRAVGYLFIPFFNLYWVFRAFGSLPKDLNAIAVARGRSTMSPSLGFTFAALFVAATISATIPYVGFVPGLVNAAVIGPLFIRRAIALCTQLQQPVRAQAPAAAALATQA